MNSKLSRLLFLSILSLLIFPISSFADQNSDSDNMVVTATKTEHLINDAPIKTIVIKNSDFKARGISSVQDILRGIPGLKITENSGSWGNKGQVLLRGLDAKHTLVLIDGHRINGGHSGIDINSYPVEIIDRIEIVKGPGSALYGSEAMGGVINIITKTSLGKKSLGFSAEAGSRDTQIYKVIGNIGDDRKGAFLAYSYKHTDGVEEKYDETNEHKLSGSFDAKFSEKTKAYSKFFFTKEFMEDDERTQKRIGINPGLVIKPNEISNLKIFGSFFRFDHETDNHKTDYTDDIYEAEVDYSRLFAKRHTLTIGSQFKRSDREDNGKGFDADENVKSVFLSDEIDFYPFVLVLGTRLDSHDEWGEEYNPKASLMYKALDNLTLRASLGRAFSAPSLSKLFGNWKMGPYYVLANEDLQPEKSIGYEFGIDYHPCDNFKTYFSFFKHEIEDLINSKKYKVGKKRYLEWVNINEAETYGAEAGLNFVLNDLTTDISYTWMHTKDEKTGKELEERPRHKADFRFSYNLKNFQTKLNLDASYTGQRFEDEENLDELNSFWTLDLSGEKHLNDHFSVFFRVENLFGEENIEDEYDVDGKLLYMGLRGNF